MLHGRKKKKLVDDLVKGGMPKDQAAKIVADVEAQVKKAKKSSRRTRGRKQLIYGTIVLAIGLAITFGTYFAAQGSGGGYIVSFGAIIVGFLSMIRGATNLARSAV